MDFWRFYRIIRRRRWLIISLVLGTTATIGLGLGLRPRVQYFQASTMVMPSEQALQRPVIGSNLTEAGARMPDRTTQMANLIELIRSRAVAERAIRKLGRRIDPDNLRNRTAVEFVRSTGETMTSMLRITVRADEPTEAVEEANAVTQEFVDFYDEVSHREATNTRRFIERQLETARETLRETSEALRKFRAAHGVISLPEETTAALGQLAPLESQRDATEAQLSDTEARLAAIRRELNKQPQTKIAEAAGDQSPVVQQLQAQLAQLENELATEKAVHTDKHPNVVALKNKIAGIRARLEKEIGEVYGYKTTAAGTIYGTLIQQIVSLETARMGLRAQLSALKRAVAERQARINNLSGAEGQLASLTRDYRAAEENYNLLVANLNRAKLEERITNTAGAIRIIDLASQAEGPIGHGTSPLKLMVAGAVLSLAIGIGLALGLDFIDDTIKTKQDVQKLLELPVTGAIPRLVGDTTAKLPQITHLEPLSPYAEAYRFLRTDLFFTTTDHLVKTIMVATAKPNQGGTATISNLAIAMAQAGKRVILVDADLRRPSLHKIFQVSNEIGLTSLLNGEGDITQALKRTEIDNLVLLPAGPLVEHPSELLGSQKMKALVEALKEHCDYVLFDTPSAVAFTDAAILSSFLDGVIVVVRAHQVPRGTELQVKNLLNKAKANILGVVLNDMQPETVDSYYYYSHYYRDIEELRQKMEREKLGAIGAQQTEAVSAVEEPRKLEEKESEGGALGVQETESLMPGEPKMVTEEAMQAEESVVAEVPKEGIVPIKPQRPLTKITRWFVITIGSIIVFGFLGLLVYFLLMRPPAIKTPKARKPAVSLQVPEERNKQLMPAVAPKDPSAVKSEQGGAVISMSKPPEIIELKAKITQDSWVRVVADGKQIYQGTLTPGENRWTAKESITIRTGNAGGIEVTQNGKYLGKLGKSGEVVERTFTRYP